MESSEPSYRMVSKKYFCYSCDKAGSRMFNMSELGDPACEECGSTCIEFVEKK